MRWLFLFLWLHVAFADTAVTYEFSGGRWGDNALAYLHAKWISYHYGIPLLYKPFPCSSECRMDLQEQHFSSSLYERVERVSGQETLDNGLSPDTLYVAPYFPEDPYELAKVIPQEGRWAYFPVDWKDEGFRKEALQALAPQKPPALIPLQPGQINIAIHVREGGGFDSAEAQRMHPLRFPPWDFYIDGLNKVLELFEGREVYCHIFTDAKEPERIVKTLKKAAGRRKRIRFGFRRDASVLDDVFSMMAFDALIRPQSNFSLIPALLGQHAVILSPRSFAERKQLLTRKKKRVVDQVHLAIDEVLYQEVLNRQ